LLAYDGENFRKSLVLEKMEIDANGGEAIRICRKYLTGFA